MDFSKFKTPDWLIIGGAIGFFIFGFLKWVTVSFEGFGSSSGGNVFDFFWTGTLPWIIVIASGVVTFLLVQGTLKREQLPWPLLILVANALATLLMIIRVIFNPVSGTDVAGIDVGRGIGMILAFVAGLVVLAGAYMNFQASGGDLKDLGDMNKLKASFSKADGTGSGDTPPPPSVDPAPPTDETPPPPPGT